jgi:hypothetical protein
MLKPTVYIPSWLTRLAASSAPNHPETHNSQNHKGIVLRHPRRRLANMQTSGRRSATG